MLKNGFAIVLLLLSILASASVANTDPCFTVSNQSSVECRKYNYDKIAAFFRDDMLIEQKVTIKRVLSKNTGQLLHANYDFEVHCHSQLNCANFDNLTGTVLWAFRNAVLNNGLYTVSYALCNPAEDKCCREGSCTEIYGVGAEKSQRSLEKDNDNYGVSIETARTERKERTLQKIESITNIMDNVMRTSRNGVDFREQSVEKVFVDMPKFAATEIGSGSYALCKLEPSGLCPRIEGRMLDYEGRGDAQFTHELGVNVQKELLDFLWTFFVEERQMNCSQSMKCDNSSGNDGCSIHMTCEKH